MIFFEYKKLKMNPES